MNTIVFEGVIEGFVINFINKNKWKLSNLHEFEDLYQEAYRIFLETFDRYIDRVENEKHFMQLYKMCLGSWWIDEAKRNSKYKNVMIQSHTISDEQETDMITNLIGDLDNEGYLDELIRTAPDDVKQVLSILLETPKDVMDLALTKWKSKGKTKPLGNQFLCNILSINHEKVDLVKKTTDFLLS